jgi:uncharacterized NAD(P)/FAD-binding protein YdhS
LTEAPPPAGELPYSTPNPAHLLNVVARNMSALADQPNHFVEWLATRSEFQDEPLAALREKFVPRRVYGDYLQSLYLWYSALLANEKDMRFDFVHDEAVDISVEDRSARIELAGGRAIVADRVILAVGNQPPSHLRLRGLDAASPKYIGNPWLGWEESLPSPDHNLLLVGTGLTMVDAFLTLQGLGWRGRIFAVSRNGLLPLSHFKGFEYPDLLDDEKAVIAFRKLFSIFKGHYRSAAARNFNPAILVDKLRPFTQRIWQGFSLSEKRQFNRHFRTRWNVARHRIAPQIHHQLQDAITAGRLEILKGRLGGCEESGDGLRIAIQGNAAGRVLEVGALINCTGPRESCVSAEPGLFSRLFSGGLMQPDEMNMGIKVAPDFSVVDSAGNHSQILFAIGALLKGTLWESTAVPELRSQAFRLAETIASQLSDNAAKDRPISEVVEDVIEYSI